MPKMLRALGQLAGQVNLALAELRNIVSTALLGLPRCLCTRDFPLISSVAWRGWARDYPARPMASATTRWVADAHIPLCPCTRPAGEADGFSHDPIAGRRS